MNDCGTCGSLRDYLFFNYSRAIESFAGLQLSSTPL